jgi:nucleoside-diphosphate-sugar epimerase
MAFIVRRSASLGEGFAACRKATPSQVRTRALHTSIKAQADKVLVCTGATGEMGPELIVRAIQRGYQVIACSRNPRKTWHDDTRVKFVKTSEDMLVNSDAWEELISEHAKGVKEVALVNLIGAAVAPKGKTLEDINVKPVMAAFHGLQRFAEGNSEVDAHMVHLSSICATVLGDLHSYSAMRKEVDEALTTLADRVNVTVFRPGLVFNDLREGKMVDMGHAWSPEQFANLPFQPILGTGNQIQQPVYQGDLCNAIINSASVKGDAIINAVGPEAMGQGDMFEYFVKLKEGSFRPVSIPYDFARVMAEHFPMGRIAPYSIAAFEELEKPEHIALPTTPFEERVGHALTSLDQVYRVHGEEPLVFAKPPVWAHSKLIIEKLIKDPFVRKEVSEAVQVHGMSVAAALVKALFAGSKFKE